MNDIKVNSVRHNCPSFYKEKVKDNPKETKSPDFFKKILR